VYVFGSYARAALTVGDVDTDIEYDAKLDPGVEREMLNNLVAGRDWNTPFRKALKPARALQVMFNHHEMLAEPVLVYQRGDTLACARGPDEFGEHDARRASEILGDGLDRRVDGVALRASGGRVRRDRVDARPPAAARDLPRLPRDRQRAARPAPGAQAAAAAGSTARHDGALGRTSVGAVFAGLLFGLLRELRDGLEWVERGRQTPVVSEESERTWSTP